MVGWLRSRFRRLVEDRYDVALSLNRADPGTVEVAERLARHLQRHGMKVFFYRNPEELRQTLGKYRGNHRSRSASPPCGGRPGTP